MRTISIKKVKPKHLPRVGGKALSCGTMKKMGLDVPDGYAITSDTFEEYLRLTGLESLYIETIESFNHLLGEDELKNKCLFFKKAIIGTEIPEIIQDSLLNIHAELEGDCSVRSSATVEDSKDFAFAGVFHSELFVEKENFIYTVQKCWSSFFDYSVLTQVLRNNIDPAAMGIALLVQEMVPADYAGALFTMDPTGQNLDVSILSVVEGTGEKLMDGNNPGLQYQVERETGKIMNQQVASYIDQDVVEKLFKVGNRLEKKFGHPQDIEWAVCNGSLYLLQARPITTIDDKEDRSIHWTRELSEERYPQPISPLGWSIMENLFQENLNVLDDRFGFTANHPEQVAKTIRNYVYSNKNFFNIPGNIKPNIFKQKMLFMRLLKEFFFVLILAVPTFFRKTKTGLKWLLVSRLFEAGIFPHAKEILSDWDKHTLGTLKKMDECAAVENKNFHFDELIDYNKKMENIAYDYFRPDLAIYIIKMACSWMVESICKEISGDEYITFLTDLTSALENNRTLEMNNEMNNMAEYINSQPDIKILFNDENYSQVYEQIKKRNKYLLDNFIHKNGHLTTNWDIMEATWGEDPDKIFHMLRGFVMSNKLRDHLENFDERQKRYKKTKEQVLKMLEKSPGLSPFFEKTLFYLREFMRIDEEHHFYCSRLFKPLRANYLEIGRRLTEKNMIEKPEDIFFIKYKELLNISETNSAFTRKYLVQSRRNSFNQSMKMRPPDNFIGQRIVLDRSIDAEVMVDGKFKGEGASSGIGIGTVRIVETTGHAQDFKEGEVFVTTSPNPAFTPLYGIASALITSTGSILSHGLVSAREYQLPAVIGIADVTNKLKNGQKVKVDGNKGIVSIL
jgi:pyruvate,water dikinase